MCDLDPINMCCWTHWIDIDQDDYLNGFCALGFEFEIADEFDDEDDFGPYDDDPGGYLNPPSSIDL